MRILIKGERGAGKTSLFKRFQGLGFSAQYNPTAEIQTATINWTFKKDDDSTVKVEVWDVVDKGFLPAGGVVEAPAAKGGARNVAQGKHRFGALDATAVDVYKNCQAAIFCCNPFSASALDYVREELEEVPAGVAVVLALCFRDRLQLSADDPSPAPPLPPPAVVTSQAGPFSAETAALLQQFKTDCDLRLAAGRAPVVSVDDLRALQEQLGLQQRADTPIVAFIGRLAPQVC
jgi:hypothetical protein